MQVQSINNTSFGILQKTKLSQYAYKSYITKDYGKFKDYDLFVQRNYLMGKLASTLICIKKAGEWTKSKLKYFENGNQSKVLRSSADGGKQY